MLREAARVLADDMGKAWWWSIPPTRSPATAHPHPAIGKARRCRSARPRSSTRCDRSRREPHAPGHRHRRVDGLEAQATRTIAERVQLIGTAHGQPRQPDANPTLSDRIQSVTLGTRRRVGADQKSVLERKAPPTFDVIVEIVDRERVRAVADTIDAMLRGDQVSPELRWRDEEGVHRSQGRPRP
jgi:hypothetical protein